jgi:hypothetical protein
MIEAKNIPLFDLAGKRVPDMLEWWALRWYDASDQSPAKF